MGLLSSFKGLFSTAKTAEKKPATKGAFGGSRTGYSAGEYNRQTRTWHASPLGPNTIAEINLETIRKRSRDMVRDSTLAESAINKWTSNVIGNGIVPHFLHEDDEIRASIQNAWDKWTKLADYDGIDSLYGLQTLASRELFEAGEVFVRFHVRKNGKLTIQLIESEQLNEFRNISMTPDGNTVKMGIVFNSDNERVGYDLWATQPFDVITLDKNAGEIIFVPASEMLHVLKRTRAGQLRSIGGHMASALILLHQIEKYAENERTRKEMAAAFAMFITRLSPDEDFLPEAESTYQSVETTQRNESQIQPGTVQYLEVGEDIKFPTLPESGDYQKFMTTELQKLASALNLTYEQLVGDYEHVSFSSARVALNEFQRAIGQYQENVIIHQMCHPIMQRWLKESVLNGDLVLPDDYVDDPSPYEDVKWVAPGFPYVNPLQDVQAAQIAMRNGITSRTQECRERGYDPDLIDAQQAQERARATKLGVVYDSDPNKVLIGRETAPLTITDAKPDQDSKKEAEDDQ